MSMTLEPRKGVSSEMNVTPLIDVLLVLLIIFMVLLPHHYFGENADIPKQTSERSTSPEDTVVIEMIDLGENQRPLLKVNQEQVAWEQLEKRLHDIYQLRMEKVAFLKGDPEVHFENVADVLDISHRAGVDRVGLMDADQKSKR
jgi:biopolymer transport protein TolR